EFSPRAPRQVLPLRSRRPRPSAGGPGRERHGQLPDGDPGVGAGAIAGSRQATRTPLLKAVPVPCRNTPSSLRVRPRDCPRTVPASGRGPTPALLSAGVRAPPPCPFRRFLPRAIAGGARGGVPPAS